MADEEAAQLPSAPFPAPPPFWKFFTASNLSALAQHQVPTKSASSKEEDQASYPSPSVNVAFLVPPPAPSGDLESYPIFSQPQPLDPSLPPPLPPAGILLFPASSPPSTYRLLLAKLTQSLLLAFLESSTILANDPARFALRQRHNNSSDEDPCATAAAESSSSEQQPETLWDAAATKSDDIKRLLFNVQWLINMYRPHQAREEVISLLEDKAESGRREIVEMNEWRNKVEAFLEGVGTESGKETASQLMTKGDAVERATGQFDQERPVNHDKQMQMVWKMIHDIDKGEED